jgi:Tol biopolymer transport system component
MTRLRSAQLAFVAFVVLACSSGGENPAAGLADRLLVVRERGIAELTFPSAEETQLAANGEFSLLFEPILSPDGTRIAYIEQLTRLPEPGLPSDFGADLYIMDRDGANPRLVAEHRSRGERFLSPTWLSDTVLLASSQRPEGNVLVATLVRLDLDTGAAETVLDGAIFVSADRPRNRIVYSRLEPAGNQTLWISAPDGGDARQLLGPDDGYSIFQSPRVSPDGRYLAFGSPSGSAIPSLRRDAGAAFVSRAPLPLARPAADRLDGLPQQIWLLDLETGDVAQLGAGVLENLDSPSLTWAGDGRIFVLETQGLFLVDTASRNAKRILRGTTHGQVEWVAAQ